MKIAISELEHLRQEVKNCHQIIKDMQKKRPWVGLTDKEIHRTTVLLGFNPEWKTEIGMAHAIVRNLEAKLKERNT